MYLNVLFHVFPYKKLLIPNIHTVGMCFTFKNVLPLTNYQNAVMQNPYK